MWTTWANASEDELRAVLAGDGLTPATVRWATAVEARRYTGDELGDDRELWIALDDAIP